MSKKGENNMIYMVSCRGMRSSFYNDIAEAEAEYLYLKKWFSGASLVRLKDTDFWKRLTKSYWKANMN